MIPPTALLVTACAINGYGWLTGSISPGRVFGNLVLLVIFTATIVSGLLRTVRRQPYRISPPTSLHAWFEGTRFSWDHFLRDPQYRILDYASSLFLAFLSVWMAGSRFLRKVSVVDFRTEMDVSKV